MPDILIVGAGISGLVCAYRLQQAGCNVRILDATAHVGGMIGSTKEEGYLLESGPNSLRLDSQDSLDLITELGLSGRILEASPNSKQRFILKGGVWTVVPSSPPAALKTGLFSTNAKLRVLKELFIARSPSTDESVDSFFSRRFGKEIFDYAVDPFVTGIYAGDPQQLSIKHTFPAIWNFEQADASVIRGALAARKKKRPGTFKSRIISFPEGLGEITNRIASRLRPNIEINSSAVSYRLENNRPTVVTDSGELISPDQVVLATPAGITGSLLEATSPVAARSLRAIHYPSVAVAYLGYRDDQFAAPIKGFGGLVPSIENRRILGVIYSSSNFPNRAPSGSILLTVLMGGARSQVAGQWSEADVIRIATEEIADLFHAQGSPEFARGRIWKHAIPQYNLGYEDILGDLEIAEREIPSLHLLGNYRGGVSIGACIRNATELARRLV